MSISLVQPFTTSEIDEIILQNQQVINDAVNTVVIKKHISLELSNTLVEKLSDSFGIPLQNPILAQVVKGDTPAHIDAGTQEFQNTYLLYLTDSQGSFIINNTEYPITKGSAFIFSEGLEHSTTGTNSSIRISIGPFNEFQQYVGAPGFTYYILTESSPSTYVYSTADYGSPGDPFTIRGYSGLTDSITSEPSYVPPGQIFLGWSITDPPTSPPDYVEGQTGLIDSFTYSLYPLFGDAPAPVTTTQENPCVDRCQVFGPAVQSNNRSAKDKTEYVDNKAIYVGKEQNLNGFGQPKPFSDYASYLRYITGKAQSNLS